jgi:hypothetical protein
MEFITHRLQPRAVGAVLALILVTLSAAHAGAADPPRGVQFSEDGRFTFVNKDVGGERFAITREQNGTVTGNVFFEDCRRPKFIVCAPTDVADALSCAVANACEAQPCGFTDAFVTNVTLPADFFQVPAEAPDDDDDEEPAEALACPTTSRAIQFSDDEARIFVNKDVGGQRYAITKFTGDDTVTGNVFVGPAVPPKFIVCAALGEPAENRFQCEVSDPCPPSPAPCSFGGFSTEVTLPADFFVLDEAATQTANAFGTTDAVTNVLRLGVATIPTGAHAAFADAQTGACPDGGTLEIDGAEIVFDQCRVASVVCSGSAVLSIGALTATLTCTDLDRDRMFDLTADLELGSTSEGAAMNGVVRTKQPDGFGFGLDYEDVSVADAPLGGGQFGTTRVSNVRTYFPGTFSDFAFPFDGSEIVIVTAFIPSPPGFIELDFELNLVTGQLTPHE